MVLNKTVFNDFQLVLLSHLHPPFEILIRSKSLKIYVNINVLGAAIETGSAICTLCLQFYCHLIYFRIT